MAALRPVGSLLALAVLLGALAVLARPHTAATYSSGAPSGFAGDQVDEGLVRTCAACHGSYTLNSGTGSVAIDVPAFVAPGQTVPVTITVVNTTPAAPGSAVRQGFQATARTAPDAPDLAGTLAITDAAATRFSQGGQDYVTQTTSGSTQSSWTFDWTAPAAPATVTFYAAGNAADGNHGLSGDHIYTATRTVAVGSTAGEGGPAAVPGLALGAPHPNPVRRGATRLHLTLDRPADLRVRVVDARGRTVRRVADGPRPAGEQTLVVSLAGLAPGLYVVVAEGEAGQAVQPVVVER